LVPRPGTILMAQLDRAAGRFVVVLPSGEASEGS
jgi:hypothetical protein